MAFRFSYPRGLKSSLVRFHWTTLLMLALGIWALPRLLPHVGALVNVGVICYLKQLLDTGFFHADPHPGASRKRMAAAERSIFPPLSLLHLRQRRA